MKSHQFLKALLIVAAGACVLVYVLKRELEPVGGLATGNEAPRIQAAGWLNGDPPSPDAFDGKVVVVQGWFTTCIYCRKETPELARTYEKYRERGVEFVSLTFEDEDQLPAIREFVEQTGMTWLTGYGAKDTLREFKAEYFPCVWVINSAGEIVWNRDSSGSLEDALDEALAGGNKS